MDACWRDAVKETRFPIVQTVTDRNSIRHATERDSSSTEVKRALTASAPYYVHKTEALTTSMRGTTSFGFTAINSAVGQRMEREKMERQVEKKRKLCDLEGGQLRVDEGSMENPGISKDTSRISPEQKHSVAQREPSKKASPNDTETSSSLSSPPPNL
ncbi:MAG: hypothetical protein M1812_005120 [Candelaria pacifica]|nr:MAG: hypothetical protein M1812_005120 [Candelaria pacifica]